MRYLGEASFWLTLLAVGVAFYLSASRGLGPGRLLAESWPLMVLVVVVVAVSMGAAWLFVRLANRSPSKARKKPTGDDGEAGPR